MYTLIGSAERAQPILDALDQPEVTPRGRLRAPANGSVFAHLCKGLVERGRWFSWLHEVPTELLRPIPAMLKNGLRSPHNRHGRSPFLVLKHRSSAPRHASHEFREGPTVQIASSTTWRGPSREAGCFQNGVERRHRMSFLTKQAHSFRAVADQLVACTRNRDVRRAASESHRAPGRRSATNTSSCSPSKRLTSNPWCSNCARQSANRLGGCGCSRFSAA